MNTISITTSQNIEVEYTLGSLGDRILGRIIDGFVLAAYAFALAAIIGFGNIGDYLTSNYWMIIVLVFPVVFYDLVCEMAFNGQSVGKKVMGIKVISLSGEQPSFSQYLVRWLLRLVDFSFSGSLVALIMVAVSDKKQRLGDLAAGTVLVKTQPRTSFEETIYVPTTENTYTVVYPEVANLRDHDVQLVREVISSVYKSQNYQVALQAQAKLEEVLGIRSRHEQPMDFLRTVLADYNYLTSRM